MAASFRVALWSLSLVASAVAAAGAQTITCPNVPANPKLTDCSVSATNGSATIVIRVMQGAAGVANQAVALSSPHSNQLPGSVTTDADGIAVIPWTGNIGTGADTITARTTIGVTVVTARIVVAAQSPSTGTIVYVTGDKQYWFQGQQLRHPATVRVDGVTQSDCPGTTVAFKAIGDGANSPDTVRARYYDVSSASSEGYPIAGCYASTWWKLGSTIGDQHLRATLPAGGNPVPFTAHSRALPWLAVGVVLSRMAGFDSVSFDSTQNKKVLVGAGHSAVFTPLFAVNFPPYYKWDWLRASIGASLTHPDRDFFAGVSLMQLGFGLNNEALGMDAQIGWHFSRQTVARDPAACVASQQCSTRSSLEGGPGVVIQANGSSLLSSLLAALK